VYVFKLAVLLSMESNLPFCVLLIEAILELKLPIEELNPLVVVATLELNEPILELNPDVVVATDEDNEPILVDILELNVEYPVVLVKST
jgi:ABC-type Fe3+-hydroxamate transport system substrate-binding protein